MPAARWDNEPYLLVACGGSGLTRYCLASMAFGFSPVPLRDSHWLNRPTLKEVVFGAAVLLVAWEGSGVEGPAGRWVPSPNQGRVHKVQTGDATVGARILARGGKRLADYGNFQLYQTGPELAQPGTSARAVLRDDYNLLLLNAAHLDTSRPEIKALRKTVGSFAGKRMHLVQFVGPVLPAWREALLGCGIQIVSYIPNNAYLIYGDATGIGAVQALAANQPHIQWEGAYLDDYKIHPAARLVDARGQPRQIGTDRFALQLIADPQLNRATLQLVDQLKLKPTQRQESVLRYLNLIVRLSPRELKALAAQPDVISIQPYFTPKKLCERQAQIVAGNLSAGLLTGPGYLAWLESKGFTQAQFDASRFVVDVSDSGIDNGTTSPGHFGLYRQGVMGDASRVAYVRLEGTRSAGSTLAGCDGHGALNAHIIAGYDDQSGFPFSDQEGYHYGLGICPFVQLGSSVIFDPDNFTSPDFNNLESRAYQAGVRVSNNSWGSSVSGAYDMDAQNFDALVRDAQPNGSANAAPDNQEMVIVVAAGNDGPNGQTIDSPATAKNVISVGGAENQQAIGGADGSGIGDDQADDGEDILLFSSQGPCADLRHKPDLVAPCTHVSGGVPQQASPGADGTALACYDGTGVSGGVGSIFFPPGQEFYTASSGTSHATPCVSGGCALVRQYFINNFTNPPSPAMVKAYLMNSARYLTGLNADDTLWSASQGMGEMNLGMAFDGTPRVLRDELAEDLFTASGQVRTFSGSISDTNKPFRVTLAWTDAPGSTTAAAYNNDLDLSVTIGGSNYYGNVFVGAFSVSGGSPDAINNVESVFLPAGTSGPFVVTVSAANINSDGIPGNAYALDQDFALVVYNGQGVVPPSILLQPTNQTAVAGANVSFQAQASGTPPLSYQWQFNRLDLVGATSSTLVLSNIQPNQMGPYWLTVTNAAGWNSTVEAWLKVLVPPSVTAAEVNGGTAAILLNSATGLTYTLQYKNALSDPQWIPLLAPIAGNGGSISFVDTNTAPVSRFYRVLCY